MLERREVEEIKTAGSLHCYNSNVFHVVCILASCMQVQVTAARDPSRLLQPTACWKERKKGPGSGMGGVMLVMPRKAVPSWRQT